jgi:AraC family transcriptional regulator, transcriptional activator of pobA
MVVSYKDKASGGEFNLYWGEALHVPNYYRQKHPVSYYTVAWNYAHKPQQVSIDGINYILPPFALVALMFNQTYSFSSAEDVVLWQFNREFYCIVNHDKEVGCAGFLFYGSWGQPIVVPDETRQKRMSLLLEVFKDEFESRDNIQGEMLRILLVRLIITITRLAKEIMVPEALPDETKFDLVRKYNLLVEMHFKEQHTVQFYAAQLFKSPKTLSNAFAKYGAKKPLEVIHERLTMEAKGLLTFTEKSIKEIAADLGFEDAGHFTRFFKNYAGQTPSEYKKAAGIHL